MSYESANSSKMDPSMNSQRNGRNSTLESSAAPTPDRPAPQRFDREVILQQSPLWSRAIVWGIVGVTGLGIAWACLFKIEEAIPAAGQLEPTGAVKEIQAPVGGMVQAVYVKNGQTVKQGDRLLTLDPAVAKAELLSLNRIHEVLDQENDYLRDQVANSLAPVPPPVSLPPDFAKLTESRRALVIENQLYRAQLQRNTQGLKLTPEQQKRLESSWREENSRAAAAQLQVEQLEKQFLQNQGSLASARDILQVNQGILNDIEPLLRDGALPKIQFLRQQQDVRTGQAEVDRLIQEEARLKLAIAQAKEQLQNTLSRTDRDLLVAIGENEKRIAEIDTQLTRAMMENQKRMVEVESRRTQTQLTLQYQDLRSPVDGTIFDLKAHTPGFVANASEPILKIVPTETLTAKVHITNRDIGFIREGMPVDVRIDSFPFSEFGDIKGKITWIGSDAMPPTDVRPFYSFPATIELDQQFLQIHGRKITLQSGMSITANIKVRDRTVMSIFTDLFTREVESLKFIR